jgi:hypothetical protein
MSSVLVVPTDCPSLSHSYHAFYMPHPSLPPFKCCDKTVKRNHLLTVNPSLILLSNILNIILTKIKELIFETSELHDRLIALGWLE